MPRLPINREQAEGVDDCLRERELPLIKGGRGRDAQQVANDAAALLIILATAALTALLLAIFTH